MTCPNCQCENCRAAAEAPINMAARALELRSQGLTLPRIAEALGTNQPNVCKLLKEARSHTA